MDLLLNLLPQGLTGGDGLLMTALTLIFYLVECGLGYKITRSSISVIGFLFGAVIGFKLVYAFSGNAGYALIGAIAVAILLSLLAYKVYLIGVFLVAAYGIFQISTTYLPLENELLLIISSVLAVIAGYLATKYMRTAIIGITAFHGGMMASTLIPRFFALPAGFTAFTLGLAVSAIGLIIQFFTSKK